MSPSPRPSTPRSPTWTPGSSSNRPARGGCVCAAVNFGSLATLLVWGIVADRIGERAVIALGQTGAAAALVWAGHASSFGWLVGALALAGALGAGVNAASGRAVMA